MFARYSLVGALAGAVGALAALQPARRGLRIQPTEALQFGEAPVDDTDQFPAARVAGGVLAGEAGALGKAHQHGALRRHDFEAVKAAFADVPGVRVESARSGRPVRGAAGGRGGARLPPARVSCIEYDASAVQSRSRG